MLDNLGNVLRVDRLFRHRCGRVVILIAYGGHYKSLRLLQLKTTRIVCAMEVHYDSELQDTYVAFFLETFGV